MTQNRFKSPIVWFSLAGLVLLILNTYGLLPKLGLTTEQFNTIISSIVGLLVSVGILNNPTDSEKI
jgi:phi LC3 family holin